MLEKVFELIQQYWPYVATTFVFILAIVLSATVILFKRNERAAIAWVGLIILSPLIGSIAYLLLGINRIKRRAVRIRPDAPAHKLNNLQSICNENSKSVSDSDSKVSIKNSGIHKGLTRLTNVLAVNELTFGNSVYPLINGDKAYPEMLKAIDNAEHSIGFETYIFKYDRTGQKFLEALGRAVDRNVEVRVLIDGVGQVYSWPPIIRGLRSFNIPSARFMFSLWPWKMPYLNLRNHQKILVVDGKIGFTGGMNISSANVTKQKVKFPIRDTHFKIEGPLVSHLSEAFADDWYITTKESLSGKKWFPVLHDQGGVVARGIPSGPHESFERARWIIAAAIGEARKSLCIMTPYFLPDETLISGLSLAAIRGVDVDIILPEKSNLPFVSWATMARVDELIAVGCRVWLGKQPFNHSKMMIVDECWSMVGSSNWDPRSLILNFEFNLECQGVDLALELGKIFDYELNKARPLNISELRKRSIFIKIRDGIARLCSPYL
jgi:cardiolipin synthase